MFSATVRFGKSCGSWCTTATRFDAVLARPRLAVDEDLALVARSTSPARILIIVLLPGAVRAGDAEDLAGRGVEVEAVERDRVAVALAEAADRDAGGSRRSRQAALTARAAGRSRRRRR